MGISLELKKSSRPVQNPPKEAAKSSPANYNRRSTKSHRHATVDSGELVKHMTNLPDYLKQIERPESSQGKILNVGVLDWSRLEQWKNNGLEKGSTSKSSGSSRSSSLVHPSRLSEQHSSSKSLKPKSTDQKMVLEMGRAPAKYRSFGTSVYPKEAKNVDQKLCSELETDCGDPKMKIMAKSVRTRNRVYQDSKQPEIIDQSFTEKGKRIVLLRPKDSLDKPITEPRKCSFSDNDHRTELPLTRKNLNPDPVEILSQEDTELTGGNSRNPSPLRRFSFSLSRMGRSLSFKEAPPVPQLSSTHVSVKSGPVNLNLPEYNNDPSKEKLQCPNRARSSPLRRLLDPLLKHKEPNTQQPNDSASDFRLPPKIISKKSITLDEKVPEFRVQALLQAKLNNGIPLFKFAVDNNSADILAATMMKSSESSGKDDSGRSFTFYLVNEIKKKSWMSQTSKDKKSCGYAYNVVAQMRLSESREFVLFGVERNQNRELAAAVVARGSRESTDERWCFRESHCGSGIAVVLPGGVHGNPSKGEPSPLIERWRSGGSCDCGGWDVGCRIRVLSEESKKSSKGFKDGRILDSFELFVQGEEEKGPIFSLVPSKDGIYSVDYSSSMTRLQAFFICVAILSSGQKVPCVTSVDNFPEPKPFDREDMIVENRGLRSKFPPKYTPIPPLSPVGRV